MRQLARQNRGQEIVEIMGDAAGQLSERFHLLRLEEMLARISS